MSEFAHELRITKQYVSFVLNKVGLGGELESGTPSVKIQARNDDNDEVQAAIAQLESQGDYTLADNLRVMLERRAAAIELRQAKRSVNRKPV